MESLKVNKKYEIENMTTLHRINGARVENRRIFVGETHPISERAPIAEAAPPAGCALSGKIGGSFAPGRKNSEKNPSDKFAFEKGTFVCFAQRSVVNLSDCQFTTNAPLRHFCYVNHCFLTPFLFFRGCTTFVIGLKIQILNGGR